MLRSAFVRCGLDFARPTTESRSVELEHRQPATFWSVVRAGRRTCVRERSFGLRVVSSLGADRRNGTTATKSDLPRNQPARVIFPVLVRALVNGDFKRPVELFYAMDRMRIISTVDHRNELLIQLRRVKAGKAMIDFMTYMRLRKMEMNGSTYSLIISVCEMDSDLKRSCMYFDQLKNSRDIPVTAYNYQSIICACVKCGNLERAKKYVDEMVDYGIELDAAVITPVFKKLGFEKEHSVKAADLCSTIIKEMERQNIRLTEEICLPALWTYSNAGYAKPLSAVYETLKELGTKFDFKLYHVVLFGYGKNPDHLEMAVRLVEDMKRDGIQPELYTYHLLLRIFSAARDEVRCLELLDEMEEAGWKPILVTYNSILVAFKKTFPEDKKAEMWQNVDDVVSKMKNQGIALDSLSYKTLLNTCIFNCSRDRGKEYLEDMKASGIPLNNTFFAKLIKLEAQCNSAGDDETAADRISALLVRMDEEGLQLDRPCCVDIMYGFINSKSVEKMKPFMEKMLEVGIVYDSLLMKLLLEFCISVGDDEMKNRVVEEALKQGHSVNKVNVDFLQVLVDLKRTPAAIEQLQKMKDDGYKFGDAYARGIIKKLETLSLSEEDRSEINAILETKSPLLQS